MNISKINSYCQKRGINLPTYEIRKTGLQHKPIFEVLCTFGDVSTIAVGTTIKKAKDKAVELIIKTLTEKQDVDYSYSLDKPLSQIWNYNNEEFILTLTQYHDDKESYKTFKVQLSQDHS